jgi:hypothetical protein
LQCTKCEATEVSEWRRSHGEDIEWQPPRDLGEANLIRIVMLLPQRKGKSTPDPWNSYVSKKYWFNIFYRDQKNRYFALDDMISTFNSLFFLVTILPTVHSSLWQVQRINCETSLITLIPELCGSEFFGSISKLCSCSLDDSNSLNLTCTRVADPIIAHLRICCKISPIAKICHAEIWYVAPILCMAIKPNFQNVQIWLVCDNFVGYNRLM